MGEEESLEPIEDRTEELDPVLSKAVRALLVLVLSEDIRIYLLNHDQKALRQAWSAIEDAIPGALFFFRVRALLRQGWPELVLDQQGQIWQTLKRTERKVVGKFDEGTDQIEYFNPVREKE